MPADSNCFQDGAPAKNRRPSLLASELRSRKWLQAPPKTRTAPLSEGDGGGPSMSYPYEASYADADLKVPSSVALSHTTLEPYEYVEYDLDPYDLQLAGQLYPYSASFQTESPLESVYEQIPPTEQQPSFSGGHERSVVHTSPGSVSGSDERSGVHTSPQSAGGASQSFECGDEQGPATSASLRLGDGLEVVVSSRLISDQISSLVRFVERDEALYTLAHADHAPLSPPPSRKRRDSRFPRRTRRSSSASSGAESSDAEYLSASESINASPPNTSRHSSPMVPSTPARRPIHQEHTLASTPSPPRLGASSAPPARPFLSPSAARLASAARTASSLEAPSPPPPPTRDVQDELVSTLRRELSPKRGTSAGMALSPGARPGVWRGYEVGPASRNHHPPTLLNCNINF